MYLKTNYYSNVLIVQIFLNLTRWLADGLTLHCWLTDCAREWVYSNICTNNYVQIRIQDAMTMGWVGRVIYSWNIVFITTITKMNTARGVCVFEFRTQQNLSSSYSFTLFRVTTYSA